MGEAAKVVQDRGGVVGVGGAVTLVYGQGALIGLLRLIDVALFSQHDCNRL